MLRVSLLGKFEVQLDGQPVALTSRPAQALLAYLLLTAGTPHRREQLAARFWPDTPDANARGNLRHVLWLLRSTLGGSDHYLRADSQAVSFDGGADYWLDTDILQQEFSGDWPVEELTETVALYGGDLLPGFNEDWAALERDRLRAVYERQMQVLLDRLAAERRWPDLRQWAERWIASGTGPEPAFRALMLAHAAQGDMTGLAAVYQRCVANLRDQLGLDPSPQTRALYETLLQGRPPELPAAPAAGPANAQAVSGPAHNLPAATTGFFGRDSQLVEIAGLLDDPTCRLVTLIGVGGIGKTRLSLQAGWAALARFPDGVFFAPLAPVGAPDRIVAAIAGALSLSFYGGVDQTEQLFNHLRGKRLLLVLDNFEHLVEGGSLVHQILERAPGVKCLVTSRERLNLRGEWAILLEGLGLPERDDVLTPEEYAAIQLFLQSARRAQAGFALADGDVAQAVRICRLAEGLPLAIELAAAWVRVLPLAEIAREIERNLDFLSTTHQDVPARHRSLRAVFDHSWTLLSPSQRRVFAWLAIFRGGFTRSIAEAAAGASLPTLTALMDKSLVRRAGGDRYNIHELLRQYALDRLRESGEEREARSAHLAAYLQLAETADPALRGADQLAWLGRLDAEHDNLRGALHWALTDERLEQGLRLSAALARFWYLRGHWPEGRDWLGKFLGQADPNEPDPALQAAAMRAWSGAGWLANESAEEIGYYTRALALSRAVGDRWFEAYSLRGLGSTTGAWSDNDRAAARLSESLQIFQGLKDAWGEALARFNLGWAALYLDSQEFQTTDWEASLAGFRQVGDRWGQAVSLSALSYASRFIGDYKRAAVYSKQALALFTELGDQAGMSDSLSRQASVAYRRSDYRLAVNLYRESLAIAETLGDRWDVAQITGVLGLIAAYQGQAGRGLALIESAIQISAEIYGRTGVSFLLGYQGIAYFTQARLAEAERVWTEALAVERDGDDRVAIGYTLHYLGLAALHRGDLERAGRMFTESHSLLHVTVEKRGVALAHYGLGRLALGRGQPAEAADYFQRSLRLRHEMGDKQGQAEALEGLGRAWSGLGPERAARLLAGAASLRDKIGAPMPQIEQADYERTLITLRVQLSDSVFDAAWQAGSAARLEDLIDEALRSYGP